MTKFLPLSFLPTVCLIIAAVSHCALAQQKPQPDNPSSLCSRDNALETIRQQIDLTRTFDDQVRRIAVLIRAADVLWPYQQDKARAAFTEAFDLARQNYKEKGDKPRLEGHLIVTVPDQRYTVISAIAKRDAAWGRRLSDQLLQEETREAEEKAAKDVDQDIRTGEKLLGTAFILLSSDQGAALNFARSSLHYPASLSFPMFLYKLAEVNKAAADGLYQEALAAYANAPMERFLYLSSYPFGNDHDVGEMPAWTAYAVPKDFVPSLELQHAFVQILLRRAQQAIESPIDTGTADRFSDSEQIWLAFTRLDRQIEELLPNLIEPVRQAKGNLFSILSQNDQQKLGDILTDRSDAMSFDKLVSGADQEKDPARRDGMLAMAVFSAANSDKPLELIVNVIEKIDNRDVRDKLLNWVYFERAQKATQEKRLAEAKGLAAKVEEIDQRAYLYLKIAEQSIKRTRNDTEARELLEEVVAAANKAPDTIVKARALLGVAYLYTKVEPSRSVSLLSDAVKCINRIDSPDFSSEDAGRKIESKGFGAYATMQTPGFNPENGFREIGRYDYDGTLYLAGSFANKPLRAMTTLALAELCLQQVPQSKPEKEKKPLRAGKIKP